MTEAASVHLELAGLSDDEADRLAADLRDELAHELARSGEAGTVARVKTEAGTLDMGATIAVILGTKAAVEVAKALHSWLARHNQASVTVKTAAGEVIAKGLESRDVPAIVAALNGTPLKGTGQS